MYWVANSVLLKLLVVSTVNGWMQWMDSKSSSTLAHALEVARENSQNRWRNEIENASNGYGWKVDATGFVLLYWTYTRKCVD